MNNKQLLTWLALALVAAGTGRRESGPQEETLSAILAAFAWNLAEDGQSPRPRLTTAGDVGRVFDDFGKRSALGVSYKSAFSAEFIRLGADLSAAAGGGREAAAAPLTASLRAKLVAIFEQHAAALK